MGGQRAHELIALCNAPPNVPGWHREQIDKPPSKNINTSINLAERIYTKAEWTQGWYFSYDTDLFA